MGAGVLSLPASPVPRQRGLRQQQSKDASRPDTTPPVYSLSIHLFGFRQPLQGEGRKSITTLLSADTEERRRITVVLYYKCQEDIHPLVQLSLFPLPSSFAAIDTGASKLIADGKIKLKTDSKIESFTEAGLEFKSGIELNAEPPTCTTRCIYVCLDWETIFRRVCGEEVAKKMKRVGGLDEEDEINGACRYVGVAGLWYMFDMLPFSKD
ncbi:hypothetical protein BDZ97DRAFT_2074631 [Flammula alnicola]|nr:hypothetical protein BDZ97DRAFT_2074631 [Flammula alnicola]